MSFQYPSSTSNWLSNAHVNGDWGQHDRGAWAESEELRSSAVRKHGGHLKTKELTQENEPDFGPGSVLNQQARRPAAGGPPNSPSPICSPSASSPASSPVNNGSQSCNGVPDPSRPEVRSPGAAAHSRGKGVKINEPGDPSSSRPDNRLALVSNRESKPTPENPEEDNDGVCDIHVTQERPRTAAARSAGRRGHHRHRMDWSDTSMGSSVSSDGESISLSREFDAVLAAAAAAGTGNNSGHNSTEHLSRLLSENSSARPPASRAPLPGIGEEEPAVRGAGEEGEDDRAYGSRRDAMALVVTTNQPAEGRAEGPIRGAARGGRDYLALVPVGVPESAGSNSDRDGPPSAWEASSDERAIVASGSVNEGSNLSTPPYNRSDVKESAALTPKQLALQKVKRERIEAKAAAWKEAEMAKVDNRFKREDAIIMAWENEQKVKANIKMKKVERKLEERRAKAFEKMQNEIAKAHRRAEDRRAVAEAKRGSETARILELVDKIRALGRVPRKFLFF